MVRECSRHGTEDESLQGYGRKALRKETIRRPRRTGRIILK
jgi:hypothetical protein